MLYILYNVKENVQLFFFFYTLEENLLIAMFGSCFGKVSGLSLLQNTSLIKDLKNDQLIDVLSDHVTAQTNHLPHEHNRTLEQLDLHRGSAVGPADNTLALLSSEGTGDERTLYLN